MERRGLSRARPRRGTTALFLLAIGAVVAGAGVAGLHYREELWDDRGHPDHIATATESSFMPVKLTSAEEVTKAEPAVTVIEAPAELDAGTPPPAPRRSKPMVMKQEPKSTTSDDGIFAKPE